MVVLKHGKEAAAGQLAAAHRQHRLLGVAGVSFSARGGEQPGLPAPQRAVAPAHGVHDQLPLLGSTAASHATAHQAVSCPWASSLGPPAAAWGLPPPAAAGPAAAAPAAAAAALAPLRILVATPPGYGSSSGSSGRGGSGGAAGGRGLCPAVVLVLWLPQGQQLRVAAASLCGGQPLPGRATCQLHGGGALLRLQGLDQRELGSCRGPEQLAQLMGLPAVQLLDAGTGGPLLLPEQGGGARGEEGAAGPAAAAGPGGPRRPTTAGGPIQLPAGAVSAPRAAKELLRSCARTGGHRSSPASPASLRL
jgi:hypothetical protein